jgi:hypothetical protein
VDFEEADGWAGRQNFLEMLRLQAHASAHGKLVSRNIRAMQSRLESV